MTSPRPPSTAAATGERKVRRRYGARRHLTRCASANNDSRAAGSAGDTGTSFATRARRRAWSARALASPSLRWKQSRLRERRRERLAQSTPVRAPKRHLSFNAAAINARCASYSAVACRLRATRDHNRRTLLQRRRGDRATLPGAHFRRGGARHASLFSPSPVRATRHHNRERFASVLFRS